jgi:AcrR family transcriptional regulator
MSQGDPRANQKARTRAAIVEAAQELQQDGLAPTIAQAAEHAGVSRATAYRYFPTQEALLLELSDVVPAVVPIEELLAGFTTEDVEQRLLLLLRSFGSITLAAEEDFRRALWVYLDTWLRSRRDGQSPPDLRVGRRMRWLEKALEPLELSEGQRRRLHAALALTMGVESLVVMKDVCRLDDDDALQVLRWAAVALLRAGLEEAEAGAPSSTG